MTPSQVTFDLCAYGTGAMSQEQRSGQLMGDEAYAGSRNFETLEAAVKDVFGFDRLCPTHNILGSVKLVAATMAPDGNTIPTNARELEELLVARGLGGAYVRDTAETTFTGNVDEAAVATALDDDVPFLLVQTFADGHHPVSLENLEALRRLADDRGVRLIVDGSRLVENAAYVRRHEPGREERSVAELVKAMAQTAHVLLFDGAHGARSNTGGLITTDDEEAFEKVMNEVVVYEGLHTYGGMAGRTMEVLARGLQEMVDPELVEWITGQNEAFAQRLLEADIPLERGCDGVYLRADAFLPELDANQAHTLAAALYLLAGIRTVAPGRTERAPLLPVQVPRLALSNDQLDVVADAIIQLHGQADRIEPLQVVEDGAWRDELAFHWLFPPLDPFAFDTAPYRIHTIERVGVLSRAAREEAMKEAGHNTFLLRSADVSIDLLTDSGTSAMSSDQWSVYEGVRASATTSDEYFDFVEAIGDAFGYEYVIPTHQGRAAEHILSQTRVRPGQLVPGNMYFTTTKLHQEMAGGVFADVIVDEAHDPESDFDWKGNIDLEKLDVLVREHGPDQVAYISFEHAVNMAGGQPVSMDNMKAVYEYCSAQDIPVFFDATRTVENAYMIQWKDARYADTPVKDILQEMMLYGDGCTVSGKKDFLINIGGCLAFRDNARWAHEAEEMLRVWEGDVTDGGLATADLAAIARGVAEMTDDRHVAARVQQTQFLGQLLLDAGIPIVTPPGSHAIFLDARRFLPHLDQDEYPAQRLAAEIYVESGVRTMERGNVSKGRNPETGENYRPALELVRLTIPRRVYTRDHMRAVADAVVAVWERRDDIKGLRFVYEPEKLRFFQGRFESL
ncbi:MAG: tryptophanase [Longimicrobiales bacterium]